MPPEGSRAKRSGMDAALSDELRHLLELAGRIALERFRCSVAERKPDGTQVTDADRAVEEVLVEALAARFPGEHVLSEEGHQVSGRPGAPTWFVDPIDGTGAYVSQLAEWGPTVCRVVDGRLQLGGLFLPRLGEYWYAEDGGGAFRDGVRLRAGDVDGVHRNDVLFAPSRFHRRTPVPWRGKVRALGSSAVHLAHVAADGGLATVIPQWKLWDVGCGALLIRESGRVVWGADGEPLDPAAVDPGLPFVAGAPTALRSLMADGWLAGIAGRAARSQGG